MRAQDRRPVYEFGPWEIDLKRRELRAHRVPVPIGSRAFEIVEALVGSAGEFVTKDDLMSRVWSGAIVEESALHVHISAVRKALGPDRGMLKTAYGRGYRLLGRWTVRQESPSAAPAELDTVPSPVPTFVTNIPVATPDLIGRQTAAEHVRELLSAHRVVTLTGPGGIGKTALAINVARRLFPTFDGDGVVVELVSLSDPKLVPSAIASVLGLKMGGDEISPDSIARAIGGEKLLLVLDNCEHVVEAAARLAETLVRLCPQTSILATSREILRIEYERVYAVPPLDVPPQHLEEMGKVLGYSAAQLFIARTTALRSDFSPLEENLPAIAAICRRLDGIPLAIEFAAARAATLGLDQVASRLDDRFRLLTAGRRTALPRHQTLRATLDWSYELLPEAERCLLRRMAIFAAGFTLEAAIAVMSDNVADASTVVDGIANLIVKSLVTLDGSVSSGRWRLLETIRAYALEKLVESGEAEWVARCHAEFFRDLYASIASGPKLQPSSEDLGRHVREIDNVRAALDWSFSPSGDSLIGAVLTAEYSPFWLHLSLVVECRERIERALDRLDPDVNQDARLRMRLHSALGLPLILTMGPVEKTRNVVTRALEVAESLDDVLAQLYALRTMWVLHFNVGDFRALQLTAERFSRVAKRTGDPVVDLVADRLIGNTLQIGGNPREAQNYLERVVCHYVAPSDQRHTTWVHYDQPVQTRAMLARVLWQQGLVTQATIQARMSVETGQAGDNKFALCWALCLAACPISLMTGDLVAAERAAAMLSDLAARHNWTLWKIVGRCLKGWLLVKRGDCATGSALLSTGLETCERTGWTMCYPEFLGALAEGLAGVGQITEAISSVDRALARVERGGDLWYLAELLRLKGELLLQQAADQSISAAEGCFVRALDVARLQGALFWELRSALGLARLRVRQGRRDDVRPILAPVYDKFTEGFETADMRAARAMLESVPPRRIGAPVKKAS
jgi:predicted ATPase/DNA-binding winged helix-turn-helix (wHTH) protein